jgi:hypothetical protein
MTSTMQLDRIIDACIDALTALMRDESTDAIIDAIDDCDSTDDATFALLNAIDDALATDALTRDRLRARIDTARLHFN